MAPTRGGGRCGSRLSGAGDCRGGLSLSSVPVSRRKEEPGAGLVSSKDRNLLEITASLGSRILIRRSIPKPGPWCCKPASRPVAETLDPSAGATLSLWTFGAANGSGVKAGEVGSVSRNESRGLVRCLLGFFKKKNKTQVLLSNKSCVAGVIPSVLVRLVKLLTCSVSMPWMAAELLAQHLVIKTVLLPFFFFVSPPKGCFKVFRYMSKCRTAGLPFPVKRSESALVVQPLL